MKTRPISSPGRTNLFLLGGVALYLGSSFLAAEKAPENLVREWKSGDGEYSLQASFSGFDQTTRRVTLQKEDATVVTVPLAKLSAADQAYIKEQAPKPVQKEAIAGSSRLYGIDWQPEIEDALTLAAGGSSPDDDRPVMWFRVLGELDGGM